MSVLLELITWIFGISAVTFIGSYYARKFNNPGLLIAMYASFVVFSNIVAVKIAKFDFFGTIFYAPAATIVFSITFLMTDIVNEKFGRKETHKMIFFAFITQVLVMLFTIIIVNFPSAEFWSGESAFNFVLMQTPRIAIASLIAFFVSENLDAIIFAKFKEITKGKKLWARNALSSLPAMLVDSILFVLMAFYGVISINELLSIIIGLTVIKWLVGLLNIPFMYANRHILYSKKLF